MSISIELVTRNTFIDAYAKARDTSELVRNATSSEQEIYEGHTKGDMYFIGPNGHYGFVVRKSGELVALFSLLRGIGRYLVGFAIEHGARKLDCFDGYLVKLYSSHGFEEVKRVPNWTEGEPDVVYMQLRK